MDWCAKHGISQNFEQWQALDIEVSTDYRMAMHAEQLMHAGASGGATQDLIAKEMASGG